MTKIALAIPTGRSKVTDVVRAFLDNAEHHGYNLKDFSVYLSIDTVYQNTKKEDFFLAPEVEARINKVMYIAEEERKEMSKQIIGEFNLKSELINNLFNGRGYSKQRNAALLFALRDNNDVAICFDDDEAPIIPVKAKDGSVSWKNMDFFGPHIEALTTGTDITRGPYMGYLSPVPSDFEKDIPSEIRKGLGEALQWGNDVITSHSFFDLMNKIRYHSEEEIIAPSRPFSVESGKNGKHIYGGNMGLNLKAFKEGRIPLFYTPPQARGEDTIFALQLEDLEVKEVNSFIFHDPFGLYPGVLDGDCPEFLRNIPVTSDTKDRFASAVTGWLKYAPILIHMTSEDEAEIALRMREMLTRIGEPTQQLADVLDCSEFNMCESVLRKYSADVKSHLTELESIQKLWRGYLSLADLNKININ